MLDWMTVANVFIIPHGFVFSFPHICVLQLVYIYCAFAPRKQVCIYSNVLGTVRKFITSHFSCPWLSLIGVIMTISFPTNGFRIAKISPVRSIFQMALSELSLYSDQGDWFLGRCTDHSGGDVVRRWFGKEQSCALLQGAQKIYLKEFLPSLQRSLAYFLFALNDMKLSP